MKMIKMTLVLTLLSAGLFAQERPIDKLFEKYAEQEGFTSVYISKYMFGLFANMAPEDTDQDDFQKVLSGLESIRILTVDDSLLNESLNFHKELVNDLPLSQYKELMVVKEKGQDVKMLFRENNGVVTEFLMISGGADNTLISITGNLDLKSIAKLSKTMNVEGLEGLEKMKENE